MKLYGYYCRKSVQACFLLLLMACGQHLLAVPSPYLVTVKHITLEQGLPSRTVDVVGQDQQGFIWVGTLEGAYRFDGKRFSPLPLPAKIRQEQVSNPGIIAIRPDRQGNLWFASNFITDTRNQYILRPGQPQPQQFSEAFSQPDPFQSDAIYDYIPSSAGPFQYVSTQRGIIWRNQGQGRFKALFKHQGLKGSEADAYRSHAWETETQTLLLTYSLDAQSVKKELIELDSTGHILQRHQLPFTARPLWKDPAGAIYLQRLSDQSLNAGSSANLFATLLYRLSPNGTLTPLPIKLGKNHFSDRTNYLFSSLRTYYDRQHNLFWVFGPRLLVAWHPTHGIVFDLAATDFPIASIHQINRVMADQTGAVWVSTLNGVLLLTLEPNRFQRYLHLTNLRGTGSQQEIRGMLTLGNKLWVNGPESQLVDPNTGQSQFVFNEARKNNYLVSMCPIVWGQDGILWTGTNGLVRIDPTTFQATRVSTNPRNLLVTILPQGNSLWLGYKNGLARADGRSGLVQPFRQYNGFYELARSQINGFFPDRRIGGIWVAASTGLYRLDTLRGIIARYRIRSKDSPLPADHITFVHPDPSDADIYWLATRGGGLLRWNRRQGQYQQFTRRQGLSDNTIYAIYEDHHHRLWLPSNYGLMSFHRNTHQVQIYHTQDGIADEEFNLIAHYRAADGRLFLGGLNGVTAFYPDQILPEKNTFRPLFVMQYQKLDTESGKMLNASAEFQEEGAIHLRASDRLVGLTFSLMDYRYLGQSRLWYRILGWQDKWVRQEAMELQINGLPAGTYTIQARAQGVRGGWASSVLSIPISVDKPVYARTWFISLVIALLIGCVWLLFRWRNQQLLSDKARLEEEVARRTAQIEADKAIIEQQAADLQANAALKTRFFANVSHEFRTPLTLLLGPIQHIRQKIRDQATLQLLGAMERNTRQLLTLISDLLDFTRLDTHQLTLAEQPADLAQVVRNVTDTFIAQAQYSGIALHASGTEQPCLMLLDSPKVETVLRNLLANAIRYTSLGGQIEVKLSQTRSMVTLVVVDTGSGIHSDDLPHIFERYFQSNQPDKALQGGTGIGLALCREYCTLWGGQITAESTLGKGSVFTVTYPLRAYSANGFERPQPISQSSASLLPERFEQRSTLNGRVAAPSGTDLKLLVVDDNLDMLLYIQTILSPYYTIHTAHNGREALVWLHQLPTSQLPSLIISDIMMPEVDGLSLATELRDSPTLRAIPLVLLTARADLESRLQALQLGVVDYLTKPFNETELLTRIQNLLRRQEEKANWMLQHTEEAEGQDLSDSVWLQKLQYTIRQHFGDELFTVKTLAEMLHVSDRQLLRRCKSLTGMSPSQLIQEVRLQVARELIETYPDQQIKKVALQVGYQKVSYFIQLYRERFGINPGEQVRQITEAETSG